LFVEGDDRTVTDAPVGPDVLAGPIRGVPASAVGREVRHDPNVGVQVRRANARSQAARVRDPQPVTGHHQSRFRLHAQAQRLGTGRRFQYSTIWRKEAGEEAAVVGVALGTSTVSELSAGMGPVPASVTRASLLSEIDSSTRASRSRKRSSASTPLAASITSHPKSRTRINFSKVRVSAPFLHLRQEPGVAVSARNDEGGDEELGELGVLLRESDTIAQESTQCVCRLRNYVPDAQWLIAWSNTFTPSE